jgi:hypothetical protein
MVLALGGDMMCFPPGTYVTMHDGSVKEIERIEVGDKIVGQNGVSSVKNVHVRKSTKRDVLKTLRTCGSFPVSGTDGHVVAVIPRECVETGWNPGGRRKGFVVRDKEGVSMDDVVWKPLANVRPGDYLISRLGCSLKPSRHKRLDGEGHLHERTGASAHLLASYSVRFASGLDVFLDIDKDVLILDDALGYRVKTIYTEHYKGDLYDLTIDGHPSYHANGYLVHNSGNIHEELVATNQQNMMPTLLDLFETMCSVIQFLRERFGRLFIPCVGGNHSRITHKTWAKDRNYTSFDWLLYCFLAKRFSDDKNITFLIPDGSDAHYKVYDHVFLLTHGDQFRGGDGVIGCLGPIIRGDVRKRSRNMQINMEYDTLLMGHWHQYIQLQRLIVNGSTKGYDEYAYVSNFPFEQPQQALWINHPKYKITYRMPVLADKMRDSKTTAWVSVMK